MVSIKSKNSERGATLTEAALLIVLVALVAVPAVKGVGIYAKKPMCGVMLGLDDRDPNDLEVLFNRDGRNTGACEYAPGQGGMGGGPNGDGYYFR